MKYFFAIVAILALAGCGMTGDKPAAGDASAEVHAEAQAAVQACKEAHAKGEIKTYVDEALCANPRIVAAYRKAKYPYMDLVYLGVSAKLAGAAKVDAGRLTDEQLESEIGQLRERIASEEQRRRAAGITQSATNVPPDGLLEGLSAFETASNPNPTSTSAVVAISADQTLAAAPPSAVVPPPAPPAPEPAPVAAAPMREAMAMPAPAPPPAPTRAPPPMSAPAKTIASPPAKTIAPAAAPAMMQAGPGYRLQYGVFAHQENATRLTKAINSPQSQVAIETGQDHAGRTLYYVRSPTYPDLDKAEAAAKAAQAAAQTQGFNEPVSYVVMAVGEAH